MFHLWPRDDFILIALGNQDKTFTVTLVAPWKGVFDKLSAQSKQDQQELVKFFQENFPDATRLLGKSVFVRQIGKANTCQNDLFLSFWGCRLKAGAAPIVMCTVFFENPISRGTNLSQ